MHDFCRREAIEVGAACIGIGAYVFAVKEFIEFEVGQVFSKANGIKGIAGGAENRTKLLGPFFETLHVVDAMVEYDTRIGMVDAIIDIITKLIIAQSLTNDFRNSGTSRGY